MADKGIVRHRGKIESTINNAKRAIELVAERGSLAAYFWSFEPGAKDRPVVVDYPTLIANPKTETSIRISKDLKSAAGHLSGQPRSTPSCRPWGW